MKTLYTDKKMPCWGAGLGCVALLGAGGGIFGRSINKFFVTNTIGYGCINFN